jgi:NCAIR mutase (PurE)-related protein
MRSRRQWAKKRAVDEARLKDLLSRVHAGSTPIADAVAELKQLPFVDLGFAMVDHHRAIRQGVPEVILGEGKTGEQIVAIARELARRGQNVLVTRIDEAKAAMLTRELEGMQHSPAARTCTLVQSPIAPLSDLSVALVSAGTSDLPVAEECAETMRMLGVQFERVFDVGVAGIHRLLHKRPILEQAGVVIVIAGMEGALASVVGGLVDMPIVAVPTSIGYGAAFQGLAAMLGMLTSCASGITVVNIDNGFGAAFAAARILRARGRVIPKTGDEL